MMSIFTQTYNKTLRYTTLGKFFGLATVGLTTLALTACNQSNQTAQAPNAEKSETASVATTNTGEKITAYTSTNVWGSIIQAVGGENVDVVIAVNDASQDPHDYQATAQDKLNISKAKLVLVNGGGYDDWATSLAKSVDNKPVIINAVDLSGLKPADEHEHEDKHEHEHEHKKDHDHAHHHHHGDFNEHVFFSLDTAKKVAEAVANQLANSDPTHKATYEQNAKDFIGKINALQTTAKMVGNGKNINAFATEPVIGYLLDDMGIKNITPTAYIEQSETDAGVSVKVLNDTKTLLQNKQAQVLIVNAQTEDATSKQLVEIAKNTGVPTVSVYETFPTGVNNYIDFMTKTIDDFAKAVHNTPATTSIATASTAIASTASSTK